MHRRILGEAGPTPWPFRWAAISLSLNLPRSSGRIGNRRRKSCVMVLSISVIASLRRREIEAGEADLETSAPWREAFTLAGRCSTT